MKQKQRCAQGASRVPKWQGCCLLVRTVVWCVQLMDNRRTTKKARRRTTQDEGREKAEKNKNRPQRGGGFSLSLYLPGVSRWSGVMSHDISQCIVIYYSISSDLTRHDISIYCIHIPNIWDWYREISYPVEIFIYTERIRNTFFCPARCSKFGAPERWRNGYLAVELHQQWYLLEKIYMYAHIWVYVVGRLGCRASKQ